MDKHRVYLRAYVPVIYHVHVEAESLEAAHAKVLEDVEKNYFDSDYWKDSETVDVEHDAAESLEVLPPLLYRGV